MTEVGQSIARYTIMELIERGNLSEFNDPLYQILVELVEDDIDCEVQ